MEKIASALKTIANTAWIKPANLPVIERYITTADEAALKSIGKPQQYAHWPHTLADALGRPDEWTEADRRVMELLFRVDETRLVLGRLDWWIGQEKPDQDFSSIVQKMFEAKDPEFTKLLVENMMHYFNGEHLNSAGRFLLAQPASSLHHAVMQAGGNAPRGALTELLVKKAPDQAKALAPYLLKKPQYGAPCDVILAMMQNAPEVFEPAVLASINDLKSAFDRYHAGQTLFQINPERYRALALKTARESLAGSSGGNNHGPVAEWMLEQFGVEVLDDMVRYFVKSKGEDHWAKEVLDDTIRVLGDKAEPAVLAVLKMPPEEVIKASKPQRDWEIAGQIDLRLRAVQHLIATNPAKHDALIEREVVYVLQSGPIQQVINAMGIAAKWDANRVEPKLWELLGHKSKQVRATAARALGKLGDAALEQGGKLLVAKKADVRSAAVSLLTAVGTDKALAMLEARLDEEPSDDVRDQILMGLAAGWEKQGRKVSRADIAKRIEKTLPKIKEPIAAWADPKRLPPPHWKDGKALTPEETAYLLCRQSRAKEIAVDIEAAPMVAMLDRAGSGDFAKAILQGFFASKQEASDKWALTIVGLLGDDRLVPPILQQIREWVDSNRGKLAEHAVQALALIGTDAALLAVDALAIRYRSKMKNVGKAAAEAFIEAAAKLGITPEELGDRVVPWLGFEPGKPRIITAGSTQIEATIGLDLKLAFKDVAKNKAVKSLPKSAGDEAIAEFKDLSANLREIVKAQMLRLENLLVRQRRWPVARWKELFLQHPLLLPMAVRLVWGCYDDAGQRTGTFRALQDRTLSTVDSDPFDLPATGTVGMIHPLELSEEDRTAWRNHLADYEIEPPFAQLERDVVKCKPEQASIKIYKDLAGTSINAMTFKGRAERLGWYRGSVCDGGGITSYYKSFPAAGADVFLGTDEFYIGIDMYSDMKLGDVTFVKHGSVQVGSYTYDEPGDEKDARILALGQVPPIVFSEVMGDLKKIAGKTDGAQEE